MYNVGVIGFENSIAYKTKFVIGILEAVDVQAKYHRSNDVYGIAGI